MRTVEIQTPFGKDIAFTKLRGYEGLSQLYEYNIILTSKNDPCRQIRTVKLGRF